MIGNPNLRHEEVALLYQHGFDIPKTKIEKILTLPRASLIEDLKEIIAEAIRNFKNYGDASDTETDENLFIAPVHAFFLLGELEAESALPIFEEFLQQDEDILDFWMGDVLTEDLWKPIYKIVKSDITRLIPFLKAPTDYVYAKAPYQEALVNYSLLHPEHRATLIPVLKDLIATLMDKAKATNEWEEDNDLLNFFVLDLAMNGFSELESEIELVVKGDLMLEYEASEWPEIQAMLKESGEIPVIEDIYDQYKEIQSWYEFADSDEFDEAAFNFEAREFDDTPKEKNIDPRLAPKTIYRETTPFKKATPDVGRNEPCPCGSGKKYKKCCLRK